MEHIKLMAILVSDVDFRALLVQVNTLVKKNKMASKYTFRAGIISLLGCRGLVLM